MDTLRINLQNACNFTLFHPNKQACITLLTEFTQRNMRPFFTGNIRFQILPKSPTYLNFARTKHRFTNITYDKLTKNFRVWFRGRGAGRPAGAGRLRLAPNRTLQLAASLPLPAKSCLSHRLQSRGSIIALSCRRSICHGPGPRQWRHLDRRLRGMLHQSRRRTLAWPGSRRILLQHRSQLHRQYPYRLRTRAARQSKSR